MTPPDAAFVMHDKADGLRRAQADGDRFTTPDVEIGLRVRPEGLGVDLTCPTRELSFVVLRWNLRLPETSLLLGDTWERSYADLQWRSFQSERPLWWSWLGHDPVSGTTTGMGVRVQPAAFCSWTLDADGVSLWLDVRTGGSPVLLGDRTLEVATIVTTSGEPDESAFGVQRRLTMAMAPDPLPISAVGRPLVGCNNWYYAYGENFGPAQILRDAETIVSYADGHPVRPYCVVDAGWTPGGHAPGGPWTAGLEGVFDNMPGLAADIAARGARPGIWMRPASLSFVDDPARLRSGPRPGDHHPLDISTQANLDAIREDVARLVGWGFELVKHDFSTFDSFARWGPLTSVDMTDGGWYFADRSRTNAELILQLYRAIRQGAGDAVVLGCNTVGHLAAGLVDAQRIGDDTSGRAWERTRRMGINTLAFRLAQHDAFFVADADCVPCTPQTPWDKNRQFLDLVARSGTALFVSVDPAARTQQTDADLSTAVRLALDGGDPGGIEPLDWLHTTTPRRWRTGSGVHTYDWLQPYGALPLPG
ncbi:MAG TPA: hypothetical protein VE287_05505 [Actinopolymorphaceae bacterium]|nr:hypothetical protein [Actinopolymorphaceae bacterium]